MENKGPYLFDVHEDEDTGECSVAIVEQSFFEDNGHLDSRHLFDEVSPLLPEVLIDEIAESIFVSELDKDETVAAMQAAGFIYEPKITANFDN